MDGSTKIGLIGFSLCALIAAGSYVSDKKEDNPIVTNTLKDLITTKQAFKNIGTSLLVPNATGDASSTIYIKQVFNKGGETCVKYSVFDPKLQTTWDLRKRRNGASNRMHCATSEP